MSDDIVTRLRSTAHTGGALIGPEAADEIERLRKWKEIADMFGECFRMDEYGQFPTSNDGDVLEAVKAWERLKKEETK